MAGQEERSNIDNILTYILIKKLMTPITNTAAYRAGLVDTAGRVIKMPETEEEKAVLTTFDKFIFKLKRLLGAKIGALHKFLYIQTMNNDFYNKLIVRGSVESRAEIRRIQADINKLQEKYDLPLETFLMGLANELVRSQDVQGY
jgi:hypothetical protein